MAQEILTVYGLKIAATLVVLFALLALMFRQRREHSASEISIAEWIAKLGGEYAVLNDVVLPGKRGMNRIDHVVVSPFGVFIMTVRRQRGKVRGREGEREWAIRSGRSKDTIYNPLWDNRKQMNALEEKIGKYPFIPVVVFTQAKLKGEYPKNVIAVKRLPGFMRKYQNRVLVSDRQKEVMEKLQALARKN